MEGLKQTSRFGDVLVLISRPQEAVYALQLLKVAFDEYFTTVAEYNRAQFELFHALGYPAAEITARRPPARSCRWTRHAPPTCRRWVSGLPRLPGERLLHLSRPGQGPTATPPGSWRKGAGGVHRRTSPGHGLKSRRPAWAT